MRRSTEDWLVVLGRQVRALRIAQNLEQSALAGLANLSVATVHNIENGRGGTLTSFVKLLRALGREEWLEQVDPLFGVPDPFEQLDRSSRPRRRRVRRRTA